MPTYSQPVSGGIAYSGTPVKRTGRSVIGNLAVNGDPQKARRSLTALPAGLGLSGTVSLVVTKIPKTCTVAGGIGAVGTLSRLISKGVIGGIGSASAMPRANTHALTGAVNLNGAIAKLSEVGGGCALEGTLAFEVVCLTAGAAVASGTLIRLIGFATAGEAESSGILYAGPTEECDGALVLEGTLATLRGSTRSGSLFPQGTLQKSVTSPTAGALGMAGELDAQSLKQLQPVSGGIIMTRVLDTLVLYKAIDASTMNLAATMNFVIEQGSTFYRKLRWLKSDGIPFDLDDFTLSMDIRAYKGAPTSILSSLGSTITIAKMGSTEPGVFSITIPNSTTARLDFTRAVFDIEATWRGNSTRLLEGEITLSREASIGFQDYYETPEGYVTMIGVVVPQRGRATSGEVSLEGTLTRIASLSRSMSGGTALAGGVTKTANKVTSGSAASTGTVRTYLPSELDGSVGLSGTLDKTYGKALAGSVDFEG